MLSCLVLLYMPIQQIWLNSVVGKVKKDYDRQTFRLCISTGVESSSFVSSIIV